MPRKPMFNLEIAEEICEAIATHPISVKKLCEKNPHWPVQETIFKWIRHYPEFTRMYFAAKCVQIEPIVDDILEIADDTSNDTVVKFGEDGKPYASCNKEWINRSRLKIDTRKWLACKLAPKIYGDRQFQDVDATVRQEDAIKELE